MIVYYFLLLYTVEVLDTFNYGIAKNIFEIEVLSEIAFCKNTSTELGLSCAHEFSGFLREVKLAQQAIERGLLVEPPKGANLSPGFLTRLTQSIRALGPKFAEKAISFLLDDFSSPKVPVSIQKILLPIVWNSGGGYSFRVSAHSESVAAEDNRGNVYSKNREYREVNLGARYLKSMRASASEASINSYINDIFARRFNITDKYSGRTIDELLGPDYQGQIAEDLRSRDSVAKRRGFRYFGKSTLIKLCSGDIAYLIDMLGQMLRDHKEIPIGTERQHLVIKQYAWKELYQLHDASSNTSLKLYDIALNFGKFSLFKLLQKKVGSVERPGEYLRIDVALDGRHEEVFPMIAELLQNGVFIDGGFSNSSQGVPARRLVFRKIFTPAFPTTYNNRDTIPMTSAHFVEFLRRPEAFVRSKMGEAGIKPASQRGLLELLVDPIDAAEV